jgi:predicted transcriptional regulator
VTYPAHLRTEARRLRAEGKKHREIAELLGVSVPTASQWTRGVLPLNKQAVDPRKSAALPALERMYREGVPIPEIAKLLGIPAPTIFDWRRELGLTKNKRAAYVTNAMREQVSKHFSKDPDGARKLEVARLYVEEQLSSVEIAQRMKISPTTVSSWLRKSGVATREQITERTREKLRAANLGDKRYNWKGGISGERRLERASMYMRLAREACFQRDDYTCRCCNERGGKLNAHHVWPFQRFPQWKYEVWNLVTLCKSCHDKFHNAAGGAVHIAIGPFFYRNPGVREAAARYEVQKAA